MAKAAGSKKSKAAKQVTNKRRRGFVDPDLKVSKRQARKDDAKFVAAKFGNFADHDDRDAAAAKKKKKKKKADEADEADASSSDDDEDAVMATGKKPPRQRTHVFKNFAQRVSEVDVDVHRTAGELRTAPLEGSACFFHEAMMKWQELNCGADFSAFCAETTQLCQSLPQLVLHQRQILDALLSRLTFDAKHSLEALMALLSALARDLRGDFLPHFPLVVDALARLLRSGVEREPELLEFVFAALARICKWLQRQLAADLPTALRMTLPLRRHRQAHVRVFAAQAVAFLLRAAPDAAVPAGISALLHEATSEDLDLDASGGGGAGEDDCEAREDAEGGETSERRSKTAKEMHDGVDGAGHLLAEAVKGAAHGLHSRAPRILSRVLTPVMPREGEGEGDGNRGADARLERAYSIAAVAVDVVAKHTRRGKCEVMWEAILGAASKAAANVVRRLESAAATASDDDDDDEDEDEAEEEKTPARTIARAGHSVGVVATAVSVYNGARVEDYEPIFTLLKRRVLPALDAAGKAAAAAADRGDPSHAGVVAVVTALAEAAHRLCLALVDSHNKAAGASGGPKSVGAAAEAWGPAVDARVPPRAALAFLDALRSRAAEGSVAARETLRALLPAATNTLTGLLESGWDAGPADDGNRTHDVAVTADAAAMLLGDVCDVLVEGEGRYEEEEGFLLVAAPAAAAVVVAGCGGEASTAEKRKKKKTKTAQEVPARRRWALLRVLPHAATAADARDATGEAIEWALGVLETGGAKRNGGYAFGAAAEAEAVLAAAMGARASLAHTHRISVGEREADVGLTRRAATAAKDCPGVLSAAAALLEDACEGASTGSSGDGPGSLEAALKIHGASLQHPSRHLRAATLRYLVAVARAAGDDVDVEGVAANEVPATLGAMLARWLQINQHDVHDVEKGGNVLEFAKRSQVAIAAMRRGVEEGKAGVEAMVETMTRCALGTFHVRLASLWPEAIKLLGALTAKQTHEKAWAALFAESEALQRACLEAHDAAAATVETDGALRGGRKSIAPNSRRGEGSQIRESIHDDVADALSRRMSAAARPVEAGTERWARLGLLLRAMAASPQAASRHPAPVAKLFLSYNAPKPDGSRRAGKAWRGGLREWLKLLKDGLSGGRALRGLEGGLGDGVRFVLERCVSADEPDVAGLAVRCLGQWRMPHLTPENAERLARLTNLDTMKEELTTLHVAPAVDSDVASSNLGGGGRDVAPATGPEHRAAFASLVVRCLLPRLKKRSGRYAPLRAAALAWIGRLEPAEIVPLIHSVLSPLEPLIKPTVGREDPERGDGDESAFLPASFRTPWMDALVVTASGADHGVGAERWLEMANDADVGGFVRDGSKRPAGFLRAAGDLLKAVGEHTRTYLDPLLSLTVVMLDAASRACEEAAAARAEAAASSAERTVSGGEDDDDDAEDEEEDADEKDEDAAEEEEEEEEDGRLCRRRRGGKEEEGKATSTTRDAREVRMLAVRFLGALFARHPGFDYSHYWPLVLRALAPMAARLPAEAGSATPPPALGVIASMAADERLARLLAPEEGTDAPRGDLSAAGGLLSAAWRALGAPRASPQTRAAALEIAESLIEQAETARFHADRARNEREQLARAGVTSGAATSAGRKKKETEADFPEHVSESLLRAHAPALLEALQAALAARASPEGQEALGRAGRGKGGSGTAMADAGRELAVLKRLGPLLGRAAASGAIADTLVPVLAVRRLDESAAAEVLAALVSVLPPRGASLDPEEAAEAAEAAGRHRAALAPLFGRLRTRHARRALVDALDAVAAHDPAAAKAAEVLADLHADSKASIEGIDYDARLGAYERLDAAWFSDAPPAAVVPVLHHVIHELRGQDMALRHAAAAALERFLEAAVGQSASSEDDAAKSMDDPDVDPDPDLDPIAGLTTAASRAAAAAAAAESSLGGAVTHVLAPGVRGLLRSPESTTRSEAISVFRRLALAWPAACPGAAALAEPKDLEQDFFANMAHLQAHRRCRALRRLGALAESGVLPPVTINGYLAPLAVASLGDAGADVASTAAAAVGSLAASLPWASYRDLLVWMLRKAGVSRWKRGGASVEGSKALHIRAAATVLEHFHEWDEEAEDRMEEEEGEAYATNVVARLVPPVVVDVLRLDILPLLENLTVVEDSEGKGGTVRPAAAAAVVSVLRLIPARDLQTDIGRVLGKIANCLRSRAQGVRDSARAALASAAAGLGAAHLPSVVALLSNRLDRGFMTHVLGATLFSLIDAAVPGADPEDVEAALPEVMPLIDADLFGRAAEEREVEAIRGAYAEARRSRSHECLVLLAQNAVVPRALPELLAPVTRRIHAASAPSLRRKLEAALAAVQKGLLANPHASPEEMLILVHSVINDGVSQEERAAEEAKREATMQEDMTLGQGAKGQKETGNRVWERGWWGNPSSRAPYDLNPPVPVDVLRLILQEKGPEAGDRYKKAKYGEDSDDDAAPEQASAKRGSHKKAPGGLADLAQTANDVPPHFNLLVVFALGLLRALLRKISGEKGVGGKGTSEENIGGARVVSSALGPDRERILQGVVPLAVRALSSQHAAIPPLAVRCLAQLSTMRLAAFDASTGALARRIMALLRECPRPNTPLAQDCLKLLNNLLKRHAAFTPTEAQFRFIVSFAFGDLEGDHREEQRSTTFSLMRAVLARRPLLPEVYDMMKTVSSLVVRANALEVRQLCAQALVQFLLDYPLGERRLQQHLEALAANLEYEHAVGRMSAMHALRDVIARFPREAVEAHAVFLFVPMVARLGADEDAECRRAAGAALSTLLKRLAGTSAGRKLLALAVGWCAPDNAVGGDPRLRRAAMQTLGLAVAASTPASPDAAHAVAQARPLVAAALVEHDPAAGCDDDDDDETVRGWQTAYYALLLIEKAVVGCPESLSREDVGRTEEGGAMRPAGALDHPAAVWAGAAALMTHRHQWVQQASSRVIGHYLAANGQAMAAAAAAGDEEEGGGPVRLERVARACLTVLEQGTGGSAVALDPGLAEQTVKNLTFASVVLLQTTPALPPRRDAADEDEGNPGEEAAREEAEETEEKPPLPWLFRRMGKVAAGGAGAARAAALRWTAAVAASLGTEGLARLPAAAGSSLLLPAVLCSDAAVKGVEEDHRVLAAEALEVLRGVLPGEAFGRAYAAVQARIAGRREARRRAKALEAVTDPEKAARAKMVKAEKRTAARKRKIQGYRAGKGASGSSKKRAREV